MKPLEQAVETARTLKIMENPGKACAMGPDRDQIYTHEFVGGNFTVTSLLGSQEHANIAKQRLKSAAELTLKAPEKAEPGNIATVEVTVTNVAAGHNLPTSLTEVRQMWLEVVVSDANGTTLLHSGNIDEDGTIDPKAEMFNARAVDVKGKHTYKPWEINRFEYNNTIPPKGSSTTAYTFLVPATVKEPLKVLATLRYRSYPQSLANQLLGKDAIILPIVDMAQKEMEVMVQN